MSLEIEAKWEVEDEKIDKIKKILKEKGKFLVKILEENLVLDDENKSIFKNGSLLRLRRTVNLKTGKEKNILTLKKKIKYTKKSKKIKIMDEIEVKFENFDSILEILRHLGYKKIWKYEKIREIWEICECKVCIDKLPKLNFFVEIEGESEDKIAKASDVLGLEKRKMMKKTYAEITIEKFKTLEDLIFEK